MAYERTLGDVEHFVFDLDGTVWEWNRLKQGVKKTVEELRKRDGECYFLTNNSLLSREQLAEKLTDLGIKTDAEHVMGSAHIAAESLDFEDVRKAFVVGEEGLRSALKQRQISHTEEADHVVVGLDRNYSYWKMATAADLVRDGAELWATATDPYWWAGDRRLPGTGAELAGILKTAEADSDRVTVLGKPSKYARKVVKEEWSLLPHQTVMIGDSLQSDVRFGNQMGWKTALVLGGLSVEADLADVSDFDKPHIVFREFDRILQKV